MSMPIAAQFAASLLVVAVQGAAGAWAWSWLRPRSSAWERLGAGLALGTAASALAGAALFPVGLFAWWLPPAAALLAALVIRRRSGTWTPSGRHVTARETWAGAVGLIAGGASIIASLRTYPLTGSGTSYHPDMLFFEALARSLGSAGPGESSLMWGSTVRYHWLTYAWTGQIAELVSPEPFLVLTRVLPLVALIACVAIVTAWASRVSRHPWAPTIAVLLLVTGGYVGASFGTILNFDSPSQQLSTAWLLALCLALLSALQQRGGAASLAAVAALGAATTAGKVSAGAVVVVGWGATVVAGFVLRRAWRGQALTALVALAAGSGAVFVAWIAGGSDAGGLAIGLRDKMASVIGLNPGQGTVAVILGTLLLLIAVGSRWIGAGWILADRAARSRPWVMLAVGMGAAGAGALIVLGQGINDSWFALSASAPLAVAAGAGTARALTRAGMPGSRPTFRVVVLAIAGLLSFGLAAVLWSIPGDVTRWAAPLAPVIFTGAAGLLLMRGGRRIVLGLTIGLTVAACASRLLPFAGSLVSTREGTRSPVEFTSGESLPLRDSVGLPAWGDDERAAAEWLRARTSERSVIATTLTRSPLVAALTARPTYLSGGHYQAPYGPPGAREEVIARDAAIRGFVEAPSATSVAPLCDAGVTWLWLDGRAGPVPDPGPWGAIALTRGNVSIVSLSGC